MASKLIGRVKCPECDFPKAHVKESEKGTVYRYCPECGAQYFPRGLAQQDRLRAAMTPTPTGSGATGAEPPAPAPVLAPQPVPAPQPAARAATPTTTAPAAPARRGLGLF